MTVTNPHLTEKQTSEIVIRGANIKSAKARILSTNDVHAHNTFENPNAVQPREASVNFKNDTISFNFDAASVTTLHLELV